MSLLAEKNTTTKYDIQKNIIKRKLPIGGPCGQKAQIMGDAEARDGQVSAVWKKLHAHEHGCWHRNPRAKMTLTTTATVLLFWLVDRGAFPNLKLVVVLQRLCGTSFGDCDYSAHMIRIYRGRK